MRVKPLKHNVGEIPKFEWKFPDGFCLVVDTREQDRLFKRPLKGLVVVVDTLSTGDYSIRGFENAIAVERKSQSDFLSSIGSGRDRFKAELERLSCFERKWIMVECSHEDLLRFNEYSQMHPNAVRQTIASIEIRFGVPFYFQPDRHAMERYILDLFVKFYKVKRGE